MTVQELKECQVCGAKPGEKHLDGCEVERCSVCGELYITCGCKGHDSGFARWTGLMPGIAEATALGLDLTDFIVKHGRQFFTKPKKKRQVMIRYQDKYIVNLIFRFKGSAKLEVVADKLEKICEKRDLVRYGEDDTFAWVVETKKEALEFGNEFTEVFKGCPSVWNVTKGLGGKILKYKDLLNADE